MSCKESELFFANLAHIRQKHSTFQPIATKINLEKVISTEGSGIFLLLNISTIFFKVKIKKTWCSHL